MGSSISMGGLVPGIPPTVVGAGTLPPGSAGNPYSYTFSGTGGTPPYSNWRASGMPAWMTINGLTGTISGTPSGAEVDSFTVAMTDAQGFSAPNAGCSLTINAVLSGAPQVIYPGYRQANAAAITWLPAIADTGANGYTYNVYVGTNPSVPPASPTFAGVLMAPPAAARAPGYWYVAVGLAPLTTYYFWVTAVQGGSESVKTGPISITTLSNAKGTTPPAPPTDPNTYLPVLGGFQLPLPSQTPALDYWRATLGATTTINNAGTASPLNPTGPLNQNCGLQYALNNAQLGDVIIATAGTVYASNNGLGTIQTAINAGSPNKTLYVVSSQCPELGGTLIPCSSYTGYYQPQAITFSVPVPYNALSATLTGPWQGRSGWFPTYFFPTFTQVGFALTFTSNLTAATTGTLTAPWPNASGYVDVRWTQSPTTVRKCLFQQNSTTVTWYQAVTTTTTAAQTIGNQEEVHPVLYQNGSSAVQWTSPILINGASTSGAVVPGNYVTPWDIAYLGIGQVNCPIIQFDRARNTGTAIYETPGSKNIRFIGIWCSPVPSNQTSDDQSIILAPSRQNIFAVPVTPPNNITYDRCGGGNDSCNWGSNPLTGGGTYSFVRNFASGSMSNHLFHQCYMWDIGSQGSEAHGLSLYGGANVCLQNTYIAASSISAFTGGVWVDINVPCTDGIWRRNYSVRPDQWRQIRLSDWVKNHWEMKVGQRFEIYHNWTQNCWPGIAGQQQGRANICLARDQNAAQKLPLGGNFQVSFSAGSALLTAAVPHGLFATVSGGSQCIVRFQPDTNFGAVTGFTIGTQYWVNNTNFTATTFQLSSSQANANANVSITPGGTGSPVNADLTSQGIQTISQYVYVQDANFHDLIMRNVGQGIELGTSDAGENQYTRTMRFHNNLVLINAGLSGTQQNLPNGWGIEMIGPLPDTEFTKNTYIINPNYNANAITQSCEAIAGSWTSGFTAYTPNMQENFSIRWTVRDNILDGTNAWWSNDQSFVGHLDYATLTFTNNVTVLDNHNYNNAAYGGTGNLFAGSYGAIGTASPLNNQLAPIDPSLWNVISGTYATSASDGGPVGCTFGLPVITTPNPLPTATVGQFYSQSLAAKIGTPPYTYWLISATPNSGLWINVKGNSISGTPQNAETTTLVIGVRDTYGLLSSATFTLTSVATGALAVVTAPGNLPNATVNGPYSQLLLASGGVPPYTWSSTIGAPFTCQKNGYVTAAPTAAGTFSGTFTVTDTTGATATSASISITVDSVLKINFVDAIDNQLRLPPGYAQCQYGAYSAQLSASGGNPPYTWSVVSGALPLGVTVSASGLVSGTLGEMPGACSGQFQVKDASLSTAVATFLVNVTNPPQVLRPNYNLPIANGFFVLGGQLYDPQGFPFTIRGVNRAHYDVNPQLNLGLNSLQANAARLFTFNATPGGSTPAQIVSDCTNQHTAFDELPIPVVSIIPGGNTPISGVYTPASLGLCARYWVDNFASYGPIQQQMILNVCNEWDLSGTGGPGNPNAQFQNFYAAVSTPIGTISGTTVTLTSANPTHPLAACIGIQQVFIAGSSATNGGYACSATLGGSAGAWTVTLNSSAGSGSGGTLWGGCVGIIRAAGYTCPIMIDAGQDSPGTPNNLLNYSGGIQLSDPLRNCIFSQHAYNYTTPFQCQVKSVTAGTNTVLTLNNTSATHPFQQLNTFYPEISVVLQGVVGTGWTNMNGAWTVNHGANFGGVAGAWTITIPFNSTGLVPANYTTNSGTVFDTANPVIMANLFGQLRGSNVCVIYGEFGPQTAVGGTATLLKASDVINACEANGLGWLAWAWDDGGPFNLTTHSAQNGVYTAFTDLSTNWGQDFFMNPRMSPQVLAMSSATFI